MKSQWALSIGLYALFLPLFILAVYSRSEIASESAPNGLAFVISAAAPLIGFAAYAAVGSAVRFAAQSIPPWLPPTLWFISGGISAISAWLLRLIAFGGPPLDAINLILSGVFTTFTIGIATIGFYSLTDRRRQMLVLSTQRERLITLQSQAEDLAVLRSAELQKVIARVVTPEIERIRRAIANLDLRPGLDRLREIQKDISTYSDDMVRRISHDVAPQGHPVDIRPSPILSTWRDSARLAASAQVSAPLTVVAALLLYLSQFNLGCTGVPLLAVSAFLVVTVGGGLLGKYGPLARPPISLLWLFMSALAGFAVYRLVLGVGPDTCTWASTWWESALATTAAITVFLGLTIVVQSSKQAGVMIRELEITNHEISEVTREFNLAGAFTQEQISQILHGPVQGRLAGATMALHIHMEQVHRGEFPSVPDLQQRVGGLLDAAADDLAALAEPPRYVYGDVAQILDDLCTQWRGFLHIDTTIHEDADQFLADHPEWVPRVTQCVEEALTNSSRHGAARRVRIDLDLDGAAYLTLNITDDGHGFSAPPLQGMGLTGITVTGGTWHLTSNSPRGAHLKVMWPLP